MSYLPPQLARPITESDIQGKEQRLSVELEAERHEIIGDFTRLQQIVWNLLKNASKFTPEGGEIRLHTRSRTGARRDLYDDAAAR